MQLELFDIEKDDRVEKLREYIRFCMRQSLFWRPSLNLSEKFKVVGSKPFDIYLEEEAILAQAPEAPEET